METSELIQFLKQPVRFCEMDHEKVRVDNATLLPIIPLKFTAECDSERQHIGCYHLLYRLLYGNDRGKKGEGVLKRILSSQQQTLCFLNAAASYCDELESLDICIRFARTHANGETNLREDDIPSPEDAEKGTRTYINMHTDILQKIENLRPRLLEIVKSHTAA